MLLTRPTLPCSAAELAAAGGELRGDPEGLDLLLHCLALPLFRPPDLQPFWRVLEGTHGDVAALKHHVETKKVIFGPVGWVLGLCVCGQDSRVSAALCTCNTAAAAAAPAPLQVRQKALPDRPHAALSEIQPDMPAEVRAAAFLLAGRGAPLVPCRAAWAQGTVERPHQPRATHHLCLFPAGAQAPATLCERWGHSPAPLQAEAI